MNIFKSEYSVNYDNIFQNILENINFNETAELGFFLPLRPSIKFTVNVININILIKEYTNITSIQKEKILFNLTKELLKNFKDSKIKFDYVDFDCTIKETINFGIYEVIFIFKNSDNN
jgi:hypothetical protein